MIIWYSATLSTDATIPTAPRTVNATRIAGMQKAVEGLSATLLLNTSSGMRPLKWLTQRALTTCAEDSIASTMIFASMDAAMLLSALIISRTATHHTWCRCTTSPRRPKSSSHPKIGASLCPACHLISASTAMIATMAPVWTSTTSATRLRPTSRSTMRMVSGVWSPQKTDAWALNATMAFSAPSITRGNSAATTPPAARRRATHPTSTCSTLMQVKLYSIWLKQTTDALARHALETTYAKAILASTPAASLPSSQSQAATHLTHIKISMRSLRQLRPCPLKIAVSRSSVNQATLASLASATTEPVSQPISPCPLATPPQSIKNSTRQGRQTTFMLASTDVSVPNATSTVSVSLGIAAREKTATPRRDQSASPILATTQANPTLQWLCLPSSEASCWSLWSSSESSSTGESSKWMILEQNSPDLKLETQLSLTKEVP